MTDTAWTVSLDLRFLAAFVALSFAAAFALGAWIRRAQGPRADAWHGATSTQYEGMAQLGEPSPHADGKEGKS